MNDKPSKSQSLIIDNFAGGGGASTGIEAALGRPVDVAINHDPQAVAMHRANHPETHHYCQSVWRANPIEVTQGRPVALAWFSPDCKHFSKAKGGKPVEKNIRDLAWVVVAWAKAVRPAVIMLENVEEFRTWGPLTEAGTPCPDRKGDTFKQWVRELKRYGYRVEARELRACDYGAPTIRKRLFVIARCDGRPIVWPERTHGPKDDPQVMAGRLKPWRVAADIIDWSLPCPSIFDTAEEIMAKHGLRAQRPLAAATLRRIARGIHRYVLDAPRPFIIRTDMASAAARNGVHDLSEPVRTQTTAGSFAVVAPTLVQAGYGEREGQAPRCLDIEAPIGTQVAGGGKHALVAAFLAQHNSGSVGHDPREPVSTLTSKPGPHGVVSVHMTYAQQGGASRSADDPLHTLTASPKDQNALVAANLIAVNHGDSGGRREYELTDPVNTQTAARGEAPVAAHLQTLRGSARRDQDVLAPLRTISAGGNHSAVIGAFLAKYYGQGAGAPVDGPLHTDTTKDRFGLVTVEIDGEAWAIADIGMRMLTPRERFRAQGFPDSYLIDQGVDEAGAAVRLTLDAQGRMCGNSVCPPLAEALVRANVVRMAESEAVA